MGNTHLSLVVTRLGNVNMLSFSSLIVNYELIICFTAYVCRCHRSLSPNSTERIRDTLTFSGIYLDYQMSSYKDRTEVSQGNDGVALSNPRNPELELDPSRHDYEF